MDTTTATAAAAVTAKAITLDEILRSLKEQTGFAPVISGSRFFGTHSDESDHDFICKWTEASCAFLLNNGFYPVKLLVNRFNLSAVYRNDALKMDCLMFKNPERRLQSMRLLKQFGVGPHLKDKDLAKKIFLVITRLEQIQEQGKEFTYV